MHSTGHHNSLYLLLLSLSAIGCTVGSDGDSNGYWVGIHGVQEVNYQIVGDNYLMHGDVVINPDSIYENIDDIPTAMQSAAMSGSQYL